MESFGRHCRPRSVASPEFKVDRNREDRTLRKLMESFGRYCGHQALCVVMAGGSSERRSTAQRFLPCPAQGREAITFRRSNCPKLSRHPPTLWWPCSAPFAKIQVEALVQRSRLAPRCGSPLTPGGSSCWEWCRRPCWSIPSAPIWGVSPSSLAPS